MNYTFQQRMSPYCFPRILLLQTYNYSTGKPITHFWKLSLTLHIYTSVGKGGRTPSEVTFGFHPSVLHQRVKETGKLKAVYILLWWTSSFILLLRNLSEFSKKILCPSNWVCSKDKAFAAVYLTFPSLWKQPYNSSSDNFTHTSYSAHSGLLSVFHQLLFL